MLLPQAQSTMSASAASASATSRSGMPGVPPLATTELSRPRADDRQLEAMALSAVRLAALGPQLAALAVRMEEQADSQARQAERIAGTTRELTKLLGTVVGRLQTASGKVHDVMGEIARIADQTRILSINASIEAARAGEQGRAFNVVAREVQDLADQTRRSTQQIETRVSAIQGSVSEVAATVAPANPREVQSSAVTVQGVNAQLEVMAGTAEGQRAGARSLRTLGEQVNTLTQELLLAVGTFRLTAHARARQDVRFMLKDLLVVAGDVRRLEQVLLGCLQGFPGFELFYVTDALGRQVTANIGRQQDGGSLDDSARGKSWRDRPWFQDALRQPGEVVVSDIYRSKATGDYCFTISTLLMDEHGRTFGVLGADVNFLKLLSADPAG
jgi:methyl-accepting chemotaxis protein